MVYSCAHLGALARAPRFACVHHCVGNSRTVQLRTITGTGESVLCDVVSMLRVGKCMEYIVSILRDAINLQYYCQYLESQNPSLRRMPLRASNFLDLGCQNAKSLKKSRAARAKEDTRHANYQDLALRNARSEDTAKMTHSIVDFVNLGAKYCQYYCQYLEVR